MKGLKNGWSDWCLKDGWRVCCMFEVWREGLIMDGLTDGWRVLWMTGW